MAIDLTDIAAGQGGFVLRGEGRYDNTARSVDSAGDVNGDGFDDLIVGARNAHVAYVVFGKAGGFPNAIDLSALDEGSGSAGFVIGIRDTFYGGISGAVAGAGDINGDGFDDLIVGAPYESPARLGSAYVVFGRASGFPGTIDPADLALGEGGFLIRGEVRGDSVGYSVAGAGDVNGDGFDDVILGGFRAAPNAGNSYVVFGKADGFAATIQLRQVAHGRGGFAIRGEDPGDQIGASVASAGDVNDDGFDDLIVGAFGSDGAGNATPNVGGAYIVFGTADGFPAAIDLGTIAQGSGGFVIHGGPFDYAGLSVATVGDVNGDGITDLGIAANNSAYVVFGRADGFPAAVELADVAQGEGGFFIRGESGGVGITGDFAGRPIASAADINGDGFDDLIIGARRADGLGDAEYDAGAAYVVFGRGDGFPAEIDLAEVAQGQGGFIILGEDDRDQAGISAAGAGDIDGDGFDDLIVGAYKADGADRYEGSGYVIFGGPFLGGADPGLGTPGADMRAGTAAADAFNGVEGRDTLMGAGGSDTLAGGNGNDILRGNLGDDLLAGGRNKDLLVGGMGADTLAGGQGEDRFRFLRPDDGPDLILDVASGTDAFQFSAAGFGGGLFEGIELGATGRFAANAEGTATSAAGIGQFVYATSAGRLLWDEDGGGGRDAVLIATLDDAPAVIAADLLVIA